MTYKKAFLVSTRIRWGRKRTEKNGIKTLKRGGKRTFGKRKGSWSIEGV